MRIDGGDCKGSYLRSLCRGKLEAPEQLARTVHDLYFLCGAEIYVASGSGRT